METTPQEANITKAADRLLAPDDSNSDCYSDQEAELNDSWDSDVMEQQISSMKEDSVERENTVSPRDLESSELELPEDVVMALKLAPEHHKVFLPNLNSVQEDNAVLRQHVITQDWDSGNTLDLWSAQTSEGFWPWKDEVFLYMGLIPTIAAATMEVQDTKSLSATVAATIVVIRYFKSIEGKDGFSWEDCTSRASSWLAGQIEPSQFASLLDQADGLILYGSHLYGSYSYNSDQDTESISVTVATVAIRRSKSIPRKDGGPWDVYTSRASSWLAGQTKPSQLASLLDQAGDLV
ncbi:hypothetical protein BX616_000725 [Lobosporangium transversale]|uniref:Uncharacterized protein n=1 Tax=Lobosporangium transversale TaxID=64571 RepID=A0A1Y2GYR5_9FUNG|nr:hypothetical protein BCR41DRAFT_392741 [Lobosporangium transversale]KAF9906410.1 hypothetical protein BX616_000725 [Lobosporangium transversale]ORZ27415.1 hypothetical protein BCR41DRAFT_392741 [Lobosporangium transversale]|eukprot:XP_021885142.1 hypothetical protein BCR41DRAFT_392741 [Lobosporangium transversale]